MAAVIGANVPPLKELSTRRKFPMLPSISLQKPRLLLKPLCSSSTSQEQGKSEPAIMCEPCNGKGWLICDFCNGQKTNVKAENKRLYRRCPSCRATGYVLCASCKVFKCVTFPNYEDGAELSLPFRFHQQLSTSLRICKCRADKSLCNLSEFDQPWLDKGQDLAMPGSA